MVKNPPVNAGHAKEVDWISGSGGSLGGGHGNPLQYSCLGNPVDRGVWWLIVHGVEKSQTQLGTQAGTEARGGPGQLLRA